MTAVPRPHDGPGGDPPWLLASANPTGGAGSYDLALAKLQYESKDVGGRRFWTARYSIRIDANRPGLSRWVITLEGRSIRKAPLPAVTRRQTR